MTAARPLTIGLTTRHGDADWIAQNNKNYLARLAEYGARAVMIAPDTPARLPSGATVTPDAEGRLAEAEMTRLLAELDGLILSGGGDVDPGYFGQAIDGADPESIDTRRDEMELALGRAALAQDLPLLGICRGCQVLNVAAGGAMRQHVDGHRSPLENPWLHAVRVEPQSRLAAIVGAERFEVNTYHHQAVDGATLAPLFAPAAWEEGAAGPEGALIEAYESRAHRWVVGVQWHPERSFELPEAHRRLWDSFMAACRGAADW